jgi:catechol 2,3-dioxygenase-like lactoylglutathione lyase family enzyme
MRIKKLRLITRDIERQQAFYSEQLGLPLVQYREAGFTVKAGETLLEFTASDRQEAGVYHLAFNISPTLLTASPDFLSERQIPIILKDNEPVVDFPNWNARSVYFYDADGNILELIGRYNLPAPTSDKHFGPAHMLNISELGLPVNDISAFIKTLQAHTAIAVWKQYGKQFKAVGDEEGLLIVVPEGRPWFPTEVPNSFLPISITMAQPGRDFHYNNGLYIFQFE